MLDGSFGWGEAHALFRVLVRDPSSWVATAVHDRRHPWSYEAFIAADNYDALIASNWTSKTRKPKPYPRPTDPPPKRLGNPGRHSQAVILAALGARGHGTPPPKRGRARDARGRFVGRPA